VQFGTIKAGLVVDKLTSLDLKFAVSAEGIAEALAVAGSTAHEFGVTLDETMAIMAAVIERTQRGATEVGRAMRTIFVRIRRPEAIEDLYKLAGVTSYTREGFRNIIPVLSELHTKWEGLSEEQRAHIAFTVSGLRQTDKFLALLKQGLQEFRKEWK